MTHEADGRDAGVGDLLLSHVVLALLITFILPTAVHLLNIAKLLSIPLGYYMAAQGCLVFLVTLAFYHAIRHDRIALTGSGIKEVAASGRAPPTLLFTVLFAIIAASLAYVADMSLSKGFERMDVGTALVIALIALVSAIGWVAKSTSSVSYPSGSSIGLGMDWLSGVAFIAAVGAIYTMGYDGLALGLGLVAGIVFHTTVIAPYEQTFATQSLPGFLAARLASRTVFFAAALIVAVCAAVMLAAQIAAAGAILALMLGLDVSDANIAAALIIAIAALLYRSGDRSGDPRPALILTGLIALVAILVPALLMALESTGLGLPHFTFGKALNEVSDLQLSLLMEGIADPVTMTPYLRPFAHLSPFNFTALVLCVMLGAAAFPRAWASRARARNSKGLGLRLDKPQEGITAGSTRALHVAAWAALVVLLAMTTAPTLAAFAKAKIYAQLDGQLALNALPSWIYQLGSVGLLEVCGEAAKSAASVATACAGSTDVMRLQDLSISIDAIWLAAPLATGLPQLVLWLLMCAGLAAILAASIATLHTIYCSVHAGEIAQSAKASHTGLAFLVAAVALVVAGTVAYLEIGDVLTLLTWAFSLSAAGLAPVLIASIWWPGAVRATTAVVSMVTGFAMAAYYILGTHFFSAHFVEVWRGLSNAAPYAFEEVAELLARCAPGVVNAETPPTPEGMASCDAIPSLERKLANWWGIKNSTAAIFGLPLGVLVLLAGAIIAPRRKP